MTDLVPSLDDICFIDAETRRIPDATIGDVTKVGAYRYAQQAFPTIWGWAQGANPVEVVALDDGFHERLSWDYDAPDWLKRFYERADKGLAFFAAWNMGFDRQIWNGPQSDFPPLRPDMTIDIMAQGAVMGLPGKLKHASQYMGGTVKLGTGDKLIPLFEPPNGATPQSRPEEWAQFRDYGGVDVDALRDIYTGLLPLPREEWEVYWANEEINDRGVGLDTRFMSAASVLNDDLKRRTDERLAEITGGRVTAVTEVQRILNYVLPTLDRHSEARDIIVKALAKVDDEGSEIRPEKLSLERERLTRVLAYFENLDELDDEEENALEVLSLREFGGSATPGKFLKGLNQSVGGRLQGQYVFNGAGQTGRMSSRGVQTHNLTRQSLGDLEAEAINDIRELDDERIDGRVRAVG